MIKIAAIPLILSLAFVSGCTNVTEAGYYWGDYSSTLYKYNKNPSKESLVAHENELLEIINYSQEKGLTVPPGIYAEIGYLNSKRGDYDKAREFYNAEIQSFPASKQFLERLIAMNKEAS